jgi:hypothetical protein
LIKTPPLFPSEPPSTLVQVRSEAEVEAWEAVKAGIVCVTVSRDLRQ